VASPLHGAPEGDTPGVGPSGWTYRSPVIKCASDPLRWSGGSARRGKFGHALIKAARLKTSAIVPYKIVLWNSSRAPSGRICGC